MTIIIIVIHPFFAIRFDNHIHIPTPVLIINIIHPNGVLVWLHKRMNLALGELTLAANAIAAMEQMRPQ